MPKGTDKIDYGYLNMDTGKFCASQSELSKQIHKGGLLRAITNFKYGQVLIAGSSEHFTEVQAKLMCMKIIKDSAEDG